MRVTALRAALVTPTSGPLAIYGEAGARALRLWAATSGVAELEVFDAHPSAAAAMRAALAQRPDVIFGPYGSGPAVRAIEAAAGRLVWNHGGATDRLARSRLGGLARSRLAGNLVNVVNVPAPAVTYFGAVLRAVHAADPTADSVSLLHAASGFGEEVARGAVAVAAELGLRLRRVAYSPGGAAHAAATLPGAAVLLVVGAFADELEAAKSLLGRPWRAAAFVGAGVEEAVAVNTGETNRPSNYWVGVTSVGRLIQAGPGRGGGSGSWRTNR